MRNHTTPRRGITIARPGFVMTLIHMIKRFRAPIFLGLVVYMIVGFRAPAGNTSMPEAAAPNVIPGRMYETNHADIDERKVQVAANQNVWKGDPAGINTDNIRQEMQQNADDRKDSNKDIYDESDNNPSYKHEDENLEDTERERERLEARRKELKIEQELAQRLRGDDERTEAQKQLTYNDHLSDSFLDKIKAEEMRKQMFNGDEVEEGVGKGAKVGADDDESGEEDQEDNQAKGVDEDDDEVLEDPEQRGVDLYADEDADEDTKSKKKDAEVDQDIADKDIANNVNEDKEIDALGDVKANNGGDGTDNNLDEDVEQGEDEGADDDKGDETNNDNTPEKKRIAKANSDSKSGHVTKEGQQKNGDEEDADDDEDEENDGSQKDTLPDEQLVEEYDSGADKDAVEDDEVNVGHEDGADGSDKDSTMDKNAADDTDDPGPITQTLECEDYEVPHKVILLRSIGNDLPPRHAVGQSYDNVRFILENEPKYVDLERRWVLNRIFLKSEEKRIIELLQKHNEKFINIAINYNEYREQPMLHEGFGAVDVLHDTTEFREESLKRKCEIVDAMLKMKNVYIINNNGGRNAMIEEGINAGATWLLPFDGNCFMTKGSWDGIKEGFKKHGCDTRYITVPMARLQSNDRLLDADFAPEATEEPQIIFRHDAKERFNVMMRYGRRPKVELLWRLKVAGPWDRWPQSIGPWEKKEWEVSDDVGEGDRAVPSAGWIPRLFSGSSKLEQKGALVNRGIGRSQGVAALIGNADWQLASTLHHYNKTTMSVYCPVALKAMKATYTRDSTDPKTIALMECARQATEEEDDLFSNHPRDFATFMLHNMCLGFASYVKDDETYAATAWTNIKAMFIDKESAMSPSTFACGTDTKCTYAKHRRTLSLHFLPDVVRVLSQLITVEDSDMTALLAWLHDYTYHTLHSEIGQDAYYSDLVDGVMIDLQMATIAGFTDNGGQFMNHTERAKPRLLRHFPKALTAKELAEGSSTSDAEEGPKTWTTLRKQTIKEDKPLEYLGVWLLFAGVGERAGVELRRYAGDSVVEDGHRVPQLVTDSPLYRASLLLFDKSLMPAKPVNTYDNDGNSRDSAQLQTLYATQHLALRLFPELRAEGSGIDLTRVPPSSQVDPLALSFFPFWNLLDTDISAWTDTGKDTDYNADEKRKVDVKDIDYVDTENIAHAEKVDKAADDLAEEVDNIEVQEVADDIDTDDIAGDVGPPDAVKRGDHGNADEKIEAADDDEEVAEDGGGDDTTGDYRNEPKPKANKANEDGDEDEDDAKDGGDDGITGDYRKQPKLKPKANKANEDGDEDEDDAKDGGDDDTTGDYRKQPKPKADKANEDGDENEDGREGEDGGGDSPDMVIGADADEGDDEDAGEAIDMDNNDNDDVTDNSKDDIEGEEAHVVEKRGKDAKHR